MTESGNGKGVFCEVAPGEVRAVLALPEGESPEGIAVYGRTLYVGNRRPAPGLGATVIHSEILRIDLSGTSSVIATLPDADDPDANGILGLATDFQGDIFAAHDSRHIAGKGVWRVRRDGSTERLAGSEEMAFPNGVTFDLAGNLYATDSELGQIWRFTPDSAGGPWAHDALLEPLPFDPLDIPLPGANGIAFYPPNHLYVANTEHGLLLHLCIEEDGTPSPVEVLAGNPVSQDPTAWIPDFRIWTIDGIAMDDNGHIHAVIPGFVPLTQRAGFQLSPLVRIDPKSGEVHLTRTIPEAFDVPLSLAFGHKEWGETSVFVTNGDLPVVPGGPGPGVIQANVGVRGYSGQTNRVR